MNLRQFNIILLLKIMAISFVLFLLLIYPLIGIVCLFTTGRELYIEIIIALFINIIIYVTSLIIAFKKLSLKNHKGKYELNICDKNIEIYNSGDLIFDLNSGDVYVNCIKYGNHIDDVIGFSHADDVIFINIKNNLNKNTLLNACKERALNANYKIENKIIKIKKLTTAST